MPEAPTAPEELKSMFDTAPRVKPEPQTEPGATLTEIISMQKEAGAPATGTPAATPVAAPATTAPATTAADAQAAPAAPAAPATKKARPGDAIRTRFAELPQAPRIRFAEAPQDDDGLDPSFTDVEREEVRLAALAEQVDPKKYSGQKEKVTTYLKKAEDFRKSNPDAGPDSSEWREFVAANKPPEIKERNALMRRLYRQEAIDAVLPAFQELTTSLYSMSAAPVIEQRMQAVQALLSDSETLKGAGFEGATIPREIVEAVLSNPEAARAKYPTEAPIVQTHLGAAREMMRLWNGMASLDPGNPLHDFCQKFIAAKSAVLKSKDPSFMSLQEWNATAEDKRAGRWTLEEQDALAMLAVNANQLADQEKAKLRNAGWRAPEPGQPAPKVEVEEPAPIAGTAGIPDPKVKTAAPADAHLATMGIRT